MGSISLDRKIEIIYFRLCCFILIVVFGVLFVCFGKVFLVLIIKF